MRALKIDPEFENKIPALTQDEFTKLEENILADGEVREPLVVWGDTIIDGHNRWKIIQKHPEIPYKVKQIDFADKYAAIVWMCRNQLGRRNVTDEQKTVLIGEAYKAQKMTQGGNRGNQHTKAASYHSDNLAKGKTADKIAADFKVGYASVIRSEQFVDGLNEADKVSPGFKAAVISGNLKAPKNVISSIRHMTEEEKKEAVSAIEEGRAVKPVKRSSPTNAVLMDSIVAGLKRQDATSTDDEFSEDFVKILEAGIAQARNWMTTKYPRCNANQNKKIIAALDATEQAIKEMKGMVTNET